jgi:hypothetical protein
MVFYHPVATVESVEVGDGLNAASLQVGSIMRVNPRVARRGGAAVVPGVSIKRPEAGCQK